MEAVFEFEKPIAALEKRIAELRALTHGEGQGEAVASGKIGTEIRAEIEGLETKVHSLIDEIYGALSPWQRVQLSRHPGRPYALDYVPLLFEDFTEIHGDRSFGDDGAMVCGLAHFENKPAVVIAQQKGRNTKQKIERNFGMARPEGYRKSERIMDLASRFRLPIFTFIDTPGAFPGMDAEERGQSEAIARAIQKMFDIESPIVATVIGEGGSGGALAVGVADRVLMQAYSTYSVISPESCASILWSDSSRQEQAASIMKMLPEDLLRLGVIDAIVPEPKGGAHRNLSEAASLLKKHLAKHLSEIYQTAESIENLKTARFAKFRRMGSLAFSDGARKKKKEV